MTLPLPPELPILPTPRERALLLLMNPDADIAGFIAVVESDPSLTTAVLRAANSAVSWPVRPIRTAGEAVVRLGTTPVKHLLTATLVRSQFARVEPAGIDPDELWMHLLGCALLCEEQAEHPDQRPVAFTAGLLHDLGRLAMAAQAPSRYREIVLEAQSGADVCVQERHFFGIDHAEFGLRICERWRLPDEVSRAVAEHHSPSPSPGVPAALATARDLLARLGIGDGVVRPGPRDPAVDEHPLLAAMDGGTRLMEAIRWFRDSTGSRGRAA